MESLAGVYDGPAQRDAPLADKNNFRLGGPADWLFTPESHEQLGPLLAWIHDRGLPLTVLGEGTNVLIRDGGVRGAVVRIGKAFAGLEWRGELALCGAGLASRSLSRRALEEGRGGFEWAAALPGNLGGALRMNAGCFGGEMADVFVSLCGWDREGRPLALDRDGIEFDYRRSSLPEGAIATEITLRLPPLDEDDRRASEERYRDILRRRADTQPAGRWTAGSTFKNPPGDHAGRLIESCGLKGQRVGGATVSKLHANFLVASGGDVTARDVETLIELIEREVARQAGVRLEREIRIYGES